MKRRRITLPITLFLLLCTAAPLSSAKPDERGGRRPPPPPQEAIDACAAKQENAACSFSGRRNDLVEGMCISPPRLESLVCAPAGRPPGHPPHSGRRD